MTHPLQQLVTKQLSNLVEFINSRTLSAGVIAGDCTELQLVAKLKRK